MSAPFGKSPKLREYIEWARKEADCAIDEGHFGKKSLIRITSPDGRSVRQIGLADNETLSHSVVALLDRRLGLDSPFPKTPDPYE